jgi:hypothetical protein
MNMEWAARRADFHFHFRLFHFDLHFELVCQNGPGRQTKPMADLSWTQTRNSIAGQICRRRRRCRRRNTGEIIAHAKPNRSA